MADFAKDRNLISSASIAHTADIKSADLPQFNLRDLNNWRESLSGLGTDPVLLKTNKFGHVSIDLNVTDATKAPQIPSSQNTLAPLPAQENTALAATSNSVREKIAKSIKENGPELENLKRLIEEGDYQKAYESAQRLGQAIQDPKFANRLFTFSEVPRESTKPSDVYALSEEYMLTLAPTLGTQDLIADTFDQLIAQEITSVETQNFSNCTVIATSKEAFESLKAEEPWGSVIKYVNPETGDLSFKHLPDEQLVQGFIDQLEKDGCCERQTAIDIANLAYRGEKAEYNEYLLRISPEQRSYLISQGVAFELPVKSHLELMTLTSHMQMREMDANLSAQLEALKLE